MWIKAEQAYGWLTQLLHNANHFERMKLEEVKVEVTEALFRKCSRRATADSCGKKRTQTGAGKER